MNKSRAQMGLVLSALFWGASGILTQITLMEMSTITLIFFRFTIATIIAIVIFRSTKFNFSYIKHGLILSSLLMVIYISSTVGLKYTSASNAGFIIGANVIFVPFINRMFFKGKVTTADYIKSIVCFIGLALITLKGSKPLNIGDLYCLIDAIAYSLYIIYNSRLDKSLCTKKLITLQYGFVSIFSVIYIIAFEDLSFHFSLNTIMAVIILGVFCTFLAFYIQLISQQNISAENASQILALIPIFTVLFDILASGMILTIPAVIGGLCVLATSLEISKIRRFLKAAFN